MIEVDLKALDVWVELGDTPVSGQRWASLKIGGFTIFSELVYDNELTSAENNIMLLFSDRLRKLLEHD